MWPPGGKPLSVNQRRGEWFGVDIKWSFTYRVRSLWCLPWLVVILKLDGLDSSRRHVSGNACEGLLRLGSLRWKSRPDPLQCSSTLWVLNWTKNEKVWGTALCFPKPLPPSIPPNPRWYHQTVSQNNPSFFKQFVVICLATQDNICAWQWLSPLEH